MRMLVVTAVALAGCANIGPFRASDDDESIDGGIAGADGAPGGDAAPPGDAPPSELGAPMKLVDIPSVPDGIALTPTYVYWLEDHAIGRVAHAGGARQALATTEFTSALATRDGEAYWLAGGTISKATDGAFAATLIHTVERPWYATIAVTAADVLFVSRSDSDTFELGRVARTGGAASTLLEFSSTPYEMQVIEPSLYVRSSSGVEKGATTTPSSLTTAINGIVSAAAVRGSRTCWAIQPDVNVYTQNLWCRTTTGSPRKIGSAQYGIPAVALGETQVFWISFDVPGRLDLMSFDFATGVTTPVWTQPTGWNPIKLVVDDTYLYWLATNDTVGAVWRARLP